MNAPHPLLRWQPESRVFAFCYFRAGVIKDSGFLIGEKQSRYRSLFFYHQELRYAVVDGFCLLLRDDL